MQGTAEHLIAENSELRAKIKVLATNLDTAVASQAVTKRKLEESLEFQTSKQQAELAHQAILAKRLRETAEEREEDLRELLQEKMDKKGFAGEALALLCRDGAPISFKKLIQCPDSIVKFFTGFATAKQYRTYYETLNKGSNLDWFRDGQKHCNKDVSKISCEDAFTLMLSVAYGGLTECMASLLFGLTVYRVSHTFAAWIGWYARFMERSAPEAGNKRFVELTARMGTYITEHGLTHIIDSASCETERPYSLPAQSALFNDYYGCTCAKWLIAIAPCGYIRYISRAYPGRISDTQLCTCGFYDHLNSLKGPGQPPSHCEADKGFYTHFPMAKIGVTLVIPATASSTRQMSETETEHTARIANERIFVEHAVRSVKRFKWLQRRIPLSQLDLLDDVLSVAAHLQNFIGNSFVKTEVSQMYPTRPTPYQIVYDKRVIFNPTLRMQEMEE